MGGEARWAVEILPPGNAAQVSELSASVSSHTGLGFSIWVLSTIKVHYILNPS